MYIGISFYLVFIPFIFASFFDIWEIKTKYRQKIFILSILLLLMTLFAGFRWSAREADMTFGDIFDYSTYKKVFEFPVLSWSDYLDAPIETKTMEIGYVFYSSICNFIFGKSYQLFLLFTSFLTVLLFYRGLLKNHIREGIFIVLFFYFSRLYFQYNFILIRQALAMVLCWYSFRFILQKKYCVYYFFILTSSLFHSSALICLFCPLILKLRIKEFYFLLLFFLLLFLSLSGIINIILVDAIKSIIFFLHLPEVLSNKLISYTLGDGEMQKMNPLNFIECIPFYYMFRTIRNKMWESREGYFYANMFYVFLLLMVCTSNFSFLTRLIQYFMYSYFFIISFYVKENHDLRNKKVLLSILVLYGSVYFIRYYFLWFNNDIYEPFFLHL